MKKPVIFILSFFIYSAVSAQYLTVEQYIDAYKDIAIREMKRMGVPASITLAQGILETESGNSALVKKSNNHFGIKCKSSWSGSSVSHDDDAAGECFRKYNTAEESYRDHSNFLRGSERYSFLFKLPAADYKGWAYGLKKAGYATNPSYPAILIRNIEQYNLQQYTLEGADDVAFYDNSKFTDDKEDPRASVITSENVASSVPPDVSGKTLFNGLKAVYAKKGTSLLAIATERNISLSRLLEFNDKVEDGLLAEDEWIFLERKLTKGNRDFYITQKEEPIIDIAQSNAIQLESLMAYNGLDRSAIIKSGTKVFLRPVPDANTDYAAEEKMHQVKPKEGLYSISKKYNVSVQDIRDWNHLASDDLRVGQKLIISK